MQAVEPTVKTIDPLFAEYAATHDVELRNKIVEDNLYLVKLIVQKYLNKGMDYDDLYQVGSLALVNAVDRFDASKGFVFSSFAMPTIIGEIKRFFRDKGWAVKVPRRLKELALQIPDIKEELYQELGHMPTIKQVADRIGETEEHVLEAMESGQGYNAQSLYHSVSEGDADGEFGGEIERATKFDEIGYENLENADIIKGVIKDLSANEIVVFKDRMLKNRTQAEIAEELGVSQMTVSRMENEIREKFRAEFHRN
jgi:RNA polymerase sigma-B factor